jgi:hypothetical protein
MKLNDVFSKTHSLVLLYLTMRREAPNGAKWVQTIGEEHDKNWVVTKNVLGACLVRKKE